jgi:hypothetical protein
MIAVFSICLTIWLAKGLIQIVFGSCQILAYPLIIFLGVATCVLACLLELFIRLWRIALGISEN